VDAIDEEFTMQDMAYLYSWNRRQPMKLIFTLLKVACEEDKPPELDVQEMPELCRETPVDNMSSFATMISCEPQIPSLTVSLAANYFENITNGEHGPSHHPPIITTTVPPPPKKRKKTSEGRAKKNSTGNIFNF